MQSASFEKHDHGACTKQALRVAEKHCAVHGLRFTPIRRRVLEILLKRHRALGAYDVLEQLNSDGAAPQPPVAYRALDFLVANGFAHRIEKRNAFIACAHPGKRHTPAFMMCRRCDLVAEAECDPEQGLLHGAAKNAGFLIENTVEEAEGICPACQSRE